MVGYCIAALGDVGRPVNTSRTLTAKDSGLSGFGRYATSCSSTPRREITSSGYPDMNSSSSVDALRRRNARESSSADRWPRAPYLPGDSTRSPLGLVSSEIIESSSLATASCRTTRAFVGSAWRRRDRLKGLRSWVTICAWCSKIRDREGGWQQPPPSLQHRAGVTFTHGICPMCAETYLGAATPAGSLLPSSAHAAPPAGAVPPRVDAASELGGG